MTLSNLKRLENMKNGGKKELFSREIIKRGEINLFKKNCNDG